MKKQKKKIIQPPVELPPIKETDRSYILWKWLIAIIAVVSFGLSVFNDYALDDFIVLVKNIYVQDGMNGIWNILSKDTFAGMTSANVMVLSGGRYRPLSLVTFAIEHQLWGNLAFMTHLINVLLYAITGVLLYSLLKKLLTLGKTTKAELIKTQAAFTTLLFITLPCHSEPVINIKGRDDILCLLFFILAIYQLLKYVRSKSRLPLLFSAVFYFLSLLSKETALTFVVIFPLILYFFTNADKNKKYLSTTIYVLLALVFLIFRYLATKDNMGTPSTDVLNNPFIHAGFSKRYATIFLTWLLYLKMLVWPDLLSYDYNYNHFPLTNFSDWRVILSLLIHVALIVFAIRQYRKKSIYSFAILFYFLIFSILSNFFFNIGAIFADRFMFIPSIGYCIVIVQLGFDLYSRLVTEKNKKLLMSAGFVLAGSIIVIFSIRNIKRCPDWKDNNSLFIADIKAAPQSAKVQMNAAIAYMTLSESEKKEKRDSLLNKAVIHVQNEIAIYPGFIDGYFNLGVAYNRLGNFEMAEKWWNKAREINPNDPRLPTYEKILSTTYYNKGIMYAGQRKIRESIDNLLMALRYDSTNPDVYYNLGGAYFTFRNLDSAKYFFQETVRLNPNNSEAIRGLKVIEMQQLQMVR